MSDIQIREENRCRKLTKHKKKANNTIIETDNCSPIEMLKLQTHEKMKTRAYREDIGKYYNMMYMIDGGEHYYRCHDGYVRTFGRNLNKYHRFEQGDKQIKPFPKD